ncbi:LLM class flavin-dependent oxidoreductase, partial [Streptomyces coeruleorubidus]
MDISVVAVGREDDSPVEEPLRVAVLADRLGYREVWAGEGPTWDSFVLATAIGAATGQATLTAGPVPVSVRDPLTIVRGAASTAAVTGRPVGVALGTSSKRVVEGVHGRPRTRPAAALAESAAAVRPPPARGRHLPHRFLLQTRGEVDLPRAVSQVEGDDHDRDDTGGVH